MSDLLQQRIIATIDREEPIDWDGLLEELEDVTDDELDEAIKTLQNNRELEYHGRRGGYILGRAASENPGSLIE